MLFIFLNCRKLKHMKSFIFLSVLSFCFIQLNAQDPAAIVKKLDDEKVKYFQKIIIGYILIQKNCFLIE